MSGDASATAVMVYRIGAIHQELTSAMGPSASRLWVASSSPRRRQARSTAINLNEGEVRLWAYPRATASTTWMFYPAEAGSR